MHDSLLSTWESFYVIVGSSAAALTGLMFVVITIAIERKSGEAGQAIDAFGTPTVVHFIAAFLVSAIMSAPWHSVDGAAISVGILGLVGILYILNTIRAARRQSVYHPVPEDWIWFIILPLVPYSTMVAAGLGLRGHGITPLFAIGAATIVLILIAVHNSWDAVTYNVIQRAKEAGSESMGGE